MPIDVRVFTPNVLPNALLKVDSERSALAFRDLIALSAGHDFLLQASNHMCAEVAFGSLHLPWVAGRLDAQAVSALRNSGASFTSAALRQAVAAPVGAIGVIGDVLLLFRAHDVLFDAIDQCRVRLSVTVALGKLSIVPKEPGLAHGLAPGEAVQRALNPAKVADPVNRIAQALFAVGTALTARTPVMHTLSDVRPGILDAPVELTIDRTRGIWELDRHIDLGDRTSFEVSAWLGGGLLEIPAPIAATGDPASKTIRVVADVAQTTAKFTELSHDAMLLLSEADPLGLALTTTDRVRQRVRVALVDDVSLVGGTANARAGHLGPMVADCFPSSTGPCALNVGATVVPGRVATRSAGNFIGSSRYGVVWSADAVKLLVRYSWETGAFPRSIVQTQTGAVRLRIDGVEQTADAISIFHLDTLDVIELEYDANGRRDVLYTRGLARVVPQFIRLQDGRELVPKDADDTVFAPSDPMPWAALGELTEELLSEPSPDLLYFEKAVTRGVTGRLGRPFVDPPVDAVVTDSRLSAPAQRVALLVDWS